MQSSAPMSAPTRSSRPRRRRLALALALATAALLAAAPGALAAAGDLDSSFGSSGFTRLGAGSALNAVAAEPDGSSIAAGSAGASTLIVKLTPSGHLDSSFGSGGAASVGAGVLRAVAIQPDGKIVVAGDDCSSPSISCATGGIVVARVNANGARDSSFGSGGVIHTLPSGRAFGVAAGPDGTIAVAGDVRGAVDGFRRGALLRLTSSGGADSSFGSGGAQVLDLGQDTAAKSVAAQADGKLVVSGSVGPGAHQIVDAFAARLNSNGALDSSFGGASTPAGASTPGVYWYFHPAGGASSSFNGAALDPAGGIALAGWDAQDLQRQALFARLACNGRPQGGFGPAGTVTLPSSNPGSNAGAVGANGVGVGGGDRVIGAGRFQDSGLAEVGVWGLQPNGAQAFFTNQPLSEDGAEARGLAIDSSGRILVAADDVNLQGGTLDGFVARYEGFGAPPKPSKAMCGGIPQGPGLDPKKPGVKAAGKKLTIDKHGRGKLKLVNKNPFKVKAKGKIASHGKVRVGHRRKKLTFDRFSRGLPASKRTVVKVKLSRAGLSALRKLGPTKVRLTLKLSDSLGNKARVRQSLRLVPKG